MDTLLLMKEKKQLEKMKIISVTKRNKPVSRMGKNIACQNDS